MDEFVPRLDLHGQIRATIPDGKPGLIVRRLQAASSDAVREFVS
jgi:hypothetical protein